MQMGELSYFSKKVTFLSVVLTFMIVILHAKTPERWGLPLNMDNPFIYLTNVFAQMGVPMFFFISGLLFYRNCDFKVIERKLYSRVHSLLIPYVIWNVLFVGIFWVLTHVPLLHNRMNMGEVLNDPVEIIYAIINARYTVLWFVKDLMIFCALSAGIYIALSNIKVALAVLALSIINALLGDYGYENICMWFPMYFTGAIVGKFYLNKSALYGDLSGIIKKPFHKRCVTALLLAVLVLLYIMAARDAGNLFYYRLLAPILVWMVVDFLLKGFITQRFQVRPWMKYMFFIYCTHQFVLNVLQKFVVMTCPPTPLTLNLTFILSPVVVIVLLICTAKMLSRYRFYSYLSGGR